MMMTEEGVFGVLETAGTYLSLLPWRLGFLGMKLIMKGNKIVALGNSGYYLARGVRGAVVQRKGRFG